MTWSVLCCTGESYNFVNSLQEIVKELVVACRCTMSDLGIFMSMQIAGYQKHHDSHSQ
jgi:hypothetical protein